MLGRDTAAGRAACLSRLEFLAAGYAASDFVYDFAEGGTHGNFHKSGIIDFAA